MKLCQVRVFATCARAGLFIALGIALANCSQVTSKYSPRVVASGQTVPKGGGTYRVGNPYTVDGRTYVPREDTHYRAEGKASWYGEDFQGRLTANGEVFDMNAISAAHPTLPLPSYVRVTNLENRRSLVVRVNDRGPYHDNRVIDLSVRAAKLLGFYDKGTTQVRVEYVGRAALNGSDDTKLAESLRLNEPLAASTHVAAAEPAPAPPKPAPEPAQAKTTIALIGRGLY